MTDAADSGAVDGDGDPDAVAAARPLARFRSALSAVVSSREAELAGAVRAALRGRARDARDLASRPPGGILRALRCSAARLAAAPRPDGTPGRLAVALALLVVASGTLTLAGTGPAAAVLGDDDRTTYTVDVGEIRLGDGGRICAASRGDGTYRVLITNATLVNATVYQQHGEDAVKTEFPTLAVDDAIVMYTRSDDEGLDLLATTRGCTDEDQTSWTVFRNRFQTGSTLRGSEGLTILTVEATGAAVPEPGGFRFDAPGENGSTSPTNVTGGTEAVADDINDAVDSTHGDRLENATGDGVDETVGNATNGPAGVDTVENATGDATDAAGETVHTVGETVANTTGDTVANTTREVTGDPPENVSGTVDGTTDAVDNTTAEVADTTGDVTDAADEVADSTGDQTTATVVNDTTARVDGTADPLIQSVEETATPADETPAWLDRVDEDEHTSVLETAEESEGGVEAVEDVTAETGGYPEAAIDDDENLTRLDNGTVLLLNGTDPARIDWGLDDTLETDPTSTESSTSGAESSTSVTETATPEPDSDSGSDDVTLFG